MLDNPIYLSFYTITRMVDLELKDFAPAKIISSGFGVQLSRVAFK
jgi:hypothetical protein